MNITIQNAEATVTCRTHGAELLSYKTFAGKEYMWQKDPAYWAKTSPILFPYIGAVPETVTIHGTDYAIPRHGFVKDVEFDVAEQGDDYVDSLLGPVTSRNPSILMISGSRLPSA